MNFRGSIQSPPVAFQIAPLVDILLFLVIFFLITWNFSRSESELDVKVPTASEGKETRRMATKVIVNIKSDGSVVMESPSDGFRATSRGPQRNRGPLSRSGRDPPG
jgi:biopolymer transport protein ExbD